MTNCNKLTGLHSFTRCCMLLLLYVTVCTRLTLVKKYKQQIIIRTQFASE